MRSQFRALAIALLVSTTALATLAAADVSERSLLLAWKGRTVVLAQRLYTLVYNERGRMGKTYESRREGVLVVTPSSGAYLQFDGRQHRQDVVVHDASVFTAAVAREYEGDSLDVRTYNRLEPVVLVQFEPGVRFVVTQVDLSGDTVRLTLMQPGGPTNSGDGVSSLTVKWPVPFSKSFLERGQVEQLLGTFLTTAAPVASK